MSFSDNENKGNMSNKHTKCIQALAYSLLQKDIEIGLKLLGRQLGEKQDYVSNKGSKPKRVQLDSTLKPYQYCSYMSPWRFDQTENKSHGGEKMSPYSMQTLYIGMLTRVHEKINDTHINHSDVVFAIVIEIAHQRYICLGRYL